MADVSEQGLDKRVFWAIGVAFAWLVGKVAGAAWGSIERKWGSLEGLLSRVGALEKQNEMQQTRIDELAKHWAAKDVRRKDAIDVLKEENRQLWEKLKERES